MIDQFGDAVMCCKHLPGEIDKYGDNIQSTCLKGDHWRQRHDQIKIAIYRLCMWAGIF